MKKGPSPSVRIVQRLEFRNRLCSSHVGSKGAKTTDDGSAEWALPGRIASIARASLTWRTSNSRCTLLGTSVPA